jgi:aminopeptidase N
MPLPPRTDVTLRGVPSIATLTEAASARDVLTQAEANERARRVSRADYEILLDLHGGSSRYRGDVTIRFAVSGPGPLFLDFRGRTIDRLEVNGSAVEPDWTGYRLTLPADVVGDDMTVRIVYENDYDTAGDGFHRFVDPEDGAEYVYTNFEPYEAHRLFPCFDQPDIKGSYSVEVRAPAGWVIVANSPLASVTDGGAGVLVHRFAASELFSSYLVALLGGSYVERRIDHRGLSLGLFARRSMERQLDEHAAEIFEVTSQGLDFYADLFDQPFPFAKYDQIFVPEYNSGAMENVGAVTYNEAYLFRDPPTDNERLDRGEVLLHELAHMWFGNLVTMRWWDDLWLNESFATYISYLALTSATRFTNAWKVFNTDIKRWAYQQDQLPTTHPIAGRADDTEIAFLNFDGITYGKGASVLKQLVKLIGLDGFGEGMRIYFRRYSWANATLRDFLACLEQGSGRSLGEWARLWLETASLNTLSADWATDGTRLTALSLRQTAPPAFPVLRPHATEIGLGHERAGRLAMTSVPATIDSADASVPLAEEIAMPSFVFPNHDDHAYAKIALDPVSLAYVRSSLDHIDDPLLRQLTWMSMWEMVRDCQLRSTEFLAICRDRLAAEADLDIVNAAVERATIALIRHVPDSLRAGEAERMFASAVARLEAATSSDARIIWARAVIAWAERKPDVERLVRLADGAESIPGFAFDQEMRWGVAIKAIAFDLPGAGERLAAEEARDHSDRGRRAMLRAEASTPRSEAKERVWGKIHGEGYGSFHLTRAAMQGFFWPNQAELVEPYVDRFFDRVRKVFETRDHPYARSYVLTLFPAYRADQRVVDRSRGVLESLNGQLPTLSRQLAEVTDELERSIRIRRYAES